MPSSFDLLPTLCTTIDLIAVSSDMIIKKDLVD